MLDLQHIPTGSRAKIQIFRFHGGTTSSWQTWTRPRGCSMAMFIAISGGAGGGGGCSGPAGTARGGGGGGNGCNIGRAVVPLFFLPDTLYVQVGARGTGGAADTDGTDGTMSSVCIAPVSADTLTQNQVVVSAAGGSQAGSPRSGGLRGTTLVGGNPGGGGSSVSYLNTKRSGVGAVQGNNGTGGGVGGAPAGANGSNVPFTGTPGGLWYPCGGGGGAGTTSADFAGGGYPALDGFLKDYKPPAPAAGSVDGSPGHCVLWPMLMYGGCGGSSSNTGPGGNGGHATIGAGGGGGGAGTTGGNGGDGGEGLVIIQCW